MTSNQTNRKGFRLAKRATENRTHKFSEQFKVCAGPSLIMLVFMFMAFWSWRKWPDLFVDFGQQLYIPWQLASGKLLYKDIVILHGPLSQHFNAFWFLLFGPSLTVLVIVNLAILACMTGIIYITIIRFTDAVSATTVCLVLLLLFAFSQYVGVGNYNFVTPYTHEVTHGMLLTAAMILALTAYLTHGGRMPCVASGACLGLALLTKVDVACAAAVTAAMGLVIACFLAPPSNRPKRIDLLFFSAAVLAPAISFFLYFLTYLSAGQAFRAIGAGFFALSSEVAKTPFYLGISGFDKPGENLTNMLTIFLVVIGFVVTAAGLDIGVQRITRNSLPVAVIGGMVFLTMLYAKLDLLPWMDLPRALPLTTSLTVAIFAALLLKYSSQEARWRNFLPMTLWTIFAVALLPKMLLNVHIYHVGFYLAMPATLVLVICLTYWIPKFLNDRWGCGVVFRSLVIALLAAGSVDQFGRSQKFYRVKNFPIGNGADTILTYAPEVRLSSRIAALTLEWIAEKTSPHATFVGLPEGIMFNYLSRRPSTVPYVNFMMPELIVFGVQRIVDAFETRPPDYVMLVDNDPSEFGVGPFGTDPRFGKPIMDWVNRYYEPVVLIGEEPLHGAGFGIKILKRSAIPDAHAFYGQDAEKK